jgi:exosortase
MSESLPLSDPPGASDSRTHWKNQIGSPGALCALGAVLLLAIGLLFERFLNLAAIWSRDANYSHGYLILPISIWLAYRNFQSSRQALRPEPVLGFATLAIGCVLLIGTTIARFHLADYLALLLVVRGGAVAIGGRMWASSLTFPLLFLFFMYPLPITWTNFASVWLQDWVSVISGKVLELFFVCHQRGNMILVAGADQPLYVAQECSGLRQLVAFVALAVLMAHLSGRGLGLGLLLILAAVPIAILSNVLRVLLMAVLIRFLGAVSVSGWLHNVPALVTLPIGLLMFFLIVKSVGDLFPVRPGPGDVGA